MSADTLSQGPVLPGRLRIYLGYAPGAGTTCALLSEGHQRAAHGTDVVVAIAETHGRTHTAGLLPGLEVIPRAKTPHHGTAAEEMDLDAVLARMPAVALVDDLACHDGRGAGHTRPTTIRSRLIRSGGGIGVHIVPCPLTANGVPRRRVLRIRAPIRGEEQ